MHLNFTLYVSNQINEYLLVEENLDPFLESENN